MLLVMATGTGKTPVAFQICWKLWNGKWNAQNDPTRRPRILYLADRVILVNDPKDKTFAPFGDARTQIRQGNTPKGRSLYFATYQSMAETAQTQGTRGAQTSRSASGSAGLPPCKIHPETKIPSSECQCQAGKGEGGGARFAQGVKLNDLGTRMPKEPGKVCNLICRIFASEAQESLRRSPPLGPPPILA
jgi:hypothetical protein